MRRNVSSTAERNRAAPDFPPPRVFSRQCQEMRRHFLKAWGSARRAPHRSSAAKRVRRLNIASLLRPHGSAAAHCHGPACESLFAAIGFTLRASRVFVCDFSNNAKAEAHQREHAPQCAGGCPSRAQKKRPIAALLPPFTAFWRYARSFAGLIVPRPHSERTVNIYGIY